MSHGSTAPRESGQRLVSVVKQLSVQCSDSSLPDLSSPQ